MPGPGFRKGNPGRKRGAKGRRASQQAVIEALAGPNGRLLLKYLVSVSLSETADTADRLSAIKILAPYVWQKLPELQEISGVGGASVPLQFIYELMPPRKTRETDDGIPLAKEWPSEAG